MTETSQISLSKSGFFTAAHALLKSPLLYVVITGLLFPAAGRSENKFLQHNLVSDIPGIADFVDSDLMNPWAISTSATSPFWITNNHSGTAKIYDTSGKPATLTVRLRKPGATAPASPTGQVFNNTTEFVLPGGKPAAFLFATEDGTISGWYNGIENNEAAITVNRSGSGTVYKGLAIASPESGPLL